MTMIKVQQVSVAVRIKPIKSERVTLHVQSQNELTLTKILVNAHFLFITLKSA